MQGLPAKQFSIVRSLFPRKIFITTLSISSLPCLFSLLTSQSAWANNLKAISNSNPTKDIASILCPVEAQSRNSSYNIRIQSYCQKQRTLRNPIPGAQDPSLPYLLTPRLGLVRGPTPTVRWNPVAGVRRYQLWLVRQGDRKVVWGTKIEASSITLPAQPELMPGEVYQLVVETDNGTSSRMEACSAILNFSVLRRGDKAYQNLEQELAEIRSQRGQGSSPQTLALQEAVALFNRSLNAEALELLKQHEYQNPSLQGQFLLGELANSQGLNQQAQGYFSRAATLATQAGNAEAVAEASKSADRARALTDQARQGICDPSHLTKPTRSAP